MYTLKNAYARINRKAGRWAEVDIANEPLASIGADYGDVVIVLGITDTKESTRSVHVDNLKSITSWATADASVTLSQWLEQIGEMTLPFDETVFSRTAHHVKYGNLHYNGYTVEPVGRNQSVDAGGSNSSKEDLFVSREGVTGTTLGKYGLYSVNGFYHMHDFDVNGVYLFGGNTTLRRCNDNQVGVMSFEDVGELKVIPITTAMIASQAKDAPLKDGVYLTIPETQAIDGWSFLFIFGGYLQMGDSSISRVGVRTFRAYPQHLNLIERYYTSKDAIDLSSLGFDTYASFKNDSVLSTKDMLSDRAIKAYLTLPQSFIVAVKTPSLFHEMQPVQTPFPGRAIMARDLFNNQPLVGAYGKGIEYRSIDGEKEVLLCGEMNDEFNFSFQYRPWKIQSAIDSKKIVEAPRFYRQFNIRILGTEK